MNAQGRLFSSRMRAEHWGLLALLVFCVVALLGYATFGRHPQWLGMFSDYWRTQLTWFYGLSFRLFGEGQSWFAGAVMLLCLARYVGMRWFSAFAAVYVLSFLSEFAGTTLGLPFGPYQYSELLGVKILGHVPVVIPVSWFFMAVPSYVLARWAFPQEERWGARVLLGALLLSMWDLSLDPAMSYLNRYWIWNVKGVFYGMPLINLMGWYLTSLGLMLVFVWLRADAWLRELPVKWMLAFYGLNVGLALGMTAIGQLWGCVALNLFAYQLCFFGMMWARRVFERQPAKSTERLDFSVDSALWRGSVASVEHTEEPTSALSSEKEPTSALSSEKKVDLHPFLSKESQQKVLDDVQESIAVALREQVELLREKGLPQLALEGQMIRPLVAYGISAGRSLPMDAFWSSALAVQMVHEASLLHDDIIDEAAERRGQPTLFASRGVGAALVMGDHLLTAAYRVVAETGSVELNKLFTLAVERTVAGELRQARAVGKKLSRKEYEEIVCGKSGELFGFSLAVAPLLSEDPRAMEFYTLGRRLGCLYQMLDDLLDYCPRARTGKPAFQDYLQGKWTWPREAFASLADGLDGDALCSALFRREDGKAPMEEALGYFDQVYQAFLAELEELAGEQPVLSAVVSRWHERAHQAVADEVAYENAISLEEAAEIKRLLEARELQEASEHTGYFAHHSKSFRFAARFFPEHEMQQVAGVYAYCRYTDDLVDGREGLSPAALHRLLDAWKTLSRLAYDGKLKQHAFLSRVMGEMAAAGVPFRYAEELIEGVRMDISPQHFRDLEELKVYTYRVASVVGCWLTELFGVHDREVLRRAAALGHAMQLTNILRDVREDLVEMGRLYLPLSVLEKHGLDASDIEAMAKGKAPISPAYRSCLRELKEIAAGYYEEAFVAIPCLPAFFQRPVAVAAWVYRGIQDNLAEHDYDNLSSRMFTTKSQKFFLTWQALQALQRERLRWKDQSTQPFQLHEQVRSNP
ncbi:MAG: carotenoid biosynthesis protein [Myxococcales bacterium]|nr:carotenoid biosynthesis protein [Myxococcales bacterium]